MSYGEKAAKAALEGRIKLHVFEPSGRRIWTVVGKTGEHWVDEESGFCTCRAYFFAGLRGTPECYHIESVRRAGQTIRGEKFPDSEYGRILAGIAGGL